MSTPAQFRPGLRLRSQVCDTEVVVTRAAGIPVDLRCGGIPMAALGGEPAETAVLHPRHRDGTMLGKRYTTSQEAAFEVLVTKAGAGSLSDGDVPLVVKEARPLPASD